MINIRYLASMPDEAIDPYADEPLYVQLAGIVRRQIESGKLQHLDPVPSESTLVQTYGVSRDTARRAMALLGSKASCSPFRIAVPTWDRGRHKAKASPSWACGGPPGRVGEPGQPPACVRVR